MEDFFRTLIREEARDLPVYVPGKPIEEVKREFGLREVIKLASNENPWGPSPRAQEAMCQAVATIERYPDGSAFVLRAALAASLGLKPQNFLFGNGSEEIVSMVAKVFFRPGDEVLMGRPTFPLYATFARLMGAVPVELDLTPEGYYPLAAMLEHLSDKTRAVFICNPNNPSGTGLSGLEIRTFVQQVPREVILVFDEAYYEFATDQFSGLEFLAQDRPVIVLRTFSKAYGLAGIRIGFAVAHPTLVDGLNRVRTAFNVDAVAQAGALAAWQDRSYLAEIVEKNRTEREFLTAKLAALGVRMFASQTNFIMAFFGAKGAGLADALLRRGIIVRPGQAFGYPDGLRISIGTHAENEKLVAALTELLQ